MQVNFGIVAVNMRVNIVAVRMRVGMNRTIMTVSRCEAVRDPLCNPGEIEHSEKDEHHSDRQLHGEANPGWDHQIEKNDARANQKNRDGMAEAPEESNEAGMANAALTANDGGHSNDVIGIRGMPHPK